MNQFADKTLVPALKSWVESANDSRSDFPIQNLPYGVFRRNNTDEEPRIGVAIGDQVLDLHGCVQANLFENSSPDIRCALSAESLNSFMSMGGSAWKATRQLVSHLLDRENAALRDDAKLRNTLLIPSAKVEMLLPARIGDYTDFYASIHHATNVGSMFRPDNPLLPNYKHLPVGYHGRASSIVVSGTDVRRPMGQLRPDDTTPPIFGPSRLLDYEMEMGFLVGTGNDLGSRVSMKDAAKHIFGMVIVNDWSARDVQKWEYQPLGPFNAKNFATTISPWVVTLDALEPFRVDGPPRGNDDPAILDYLMPMEEMGIDMTVEVFLSSEKMRRKSLEPVRISRGSFSQMYWTIAQMLVHHTSTGCNLQPGDLIATGTISGPDEEARGCLLERTWRGKTPIELPDGTQRKFLQDGDEVIMKAYCERDGFARIGYGQCRGIIFPAAV